MIKKWVLLIGVLIMAVLTGCSTSIDSQDHTENTTEFPISIYLLNGSSDALVEVEVMVDGTSQASQIDGIMQSLMYGESSVGYIRTIPIDTMVDDVQLLDKGARVYVTSDFSEMDDITYLTCRSSIIKSLTAVEGINFVEFYEDNLPMKDDWGKVYGAFYPEDIITMSNSTNTVTQSKNISLYYPDTQGEYIVQVSREIDLLNGETIEERLIEELMVNEGDQMSPIPDGTIVKNVHVTNGICYVDFNAAFRDNHYGGSTGELMTVYSIVNTLTELPGISRVQFLIEGEKVDSYKGHLDFSELFEFNIEIVSQASSKK